MSIIMKRQLEGSLQHIDNYTPKPNDTKICQWYCCSCGQSYGSIIYKPTSEVDDVTPTHPTFPTLPATEPIPAASGAITTEEDPKDGDASTNQLNDYLIKSIKYYSQIVYNKLDTPTIPEEETNPYADEINPYEFPEVRRSSSFNDVISPTLLAETNSVVTPTPIYIRTTTSTTPASNYDYDDMGRDDVILNIPTRFTCHRCDHMMCPYCPKVRVKDLSLP
ncbi:hypothetical protein DICA1_E22100 [Diutina catenulata]